MSEPVPLRRELGPPGEDPGDSHLADARPHAFEAESQSFQELWRREHASDVVPRLENGNGLVDAVVLVGLEVLRPPFLDQLDYPPRVQVYAETDATAILRQVLDGQTQTARA